MSASIGIRSPLTAKIAGASSRYPRSPLLSTPSRTGTIASIRRASAKSSESGPLFCSISTSQIGVSRSCATILPRSSTISIAASPDSHVPGSPRDTDCEHCRQLTGLFAKNRSKRCGIVEARGVALHLAFPFGPREETGGVDTVCLHRFDLCATDAPDAKRETRLLYAVLGSVEIGRGQVTDLRLASE